VLIALTSGGCNRERRTDADRHAYPIPEARFEPGDASGARCKSQAEVLRWGKHYAVPGDGVGSWCLQDPASDVFRTSCWFVRGVCRAIEHDLVYDDSDRLVRIRVHRRGRIVNENGVAYGFPRGVLNSDLHAGQPLHEIPDEYRNPRSFETVVDPEVGKIEIWHYDGMDLEIDRVDGGEVVGAIVIHR